MIRLVIVNPYSGNKRGKKYAKTIEKIFSNLKMRNEDFNDVVFVEYTEYIGHATKIVSDYLKKYMCEKITVYVVGGDGTLSEVATAIKNNDNVSMVVIPKGTGNDFAKAINSYRSIRKIIKSSIENNKEKVDTISLKDKTCVNMINSGMDAAIVSNLVKFRKFHLLTGKMKYRLAILYTVFLPKVYNMKIRVDDKVFKGKYTLVAIGNNKYCGSGVNMLPDADIQDGILDVCIVDNTTLIQKIIYLPELTKGKVKDIYLAKLLTGKKVTVSSNKKFPVSIDGEVIFTKGFIAKVNEKSLNVIKTLDI